MSIAGGPVGRPQDGADLVFHQRPQRIPAAALRLDRGDDLVGRRDADVRGDQRFLERVDRLDVDRPAPLRGLVGAPDDLVEAFDELLLGARERLFDAIEETHDVGVGSRLPNRPLRRAAGAA